MTRPLRRTDPPPSILTQAAALGPSVLAFVNTFWEDGLTSLARSAARITRLATAFGVDRLQAACARAIFYNQCDYTTVHRILRLKLDRLPLDPQTDIYGQLPLWTDNDLNDSGVSNAV